MSIQKTLGGDRLGSGKKLKVQMHNYERSTHDLGYIWRSSMSCGTLVPFMSVLGLPGDTFDIDLNADCKTLPTVGPMFGSFKMQLDVFKCDIRLYQALLHNNQLGIGMDMSKIKLPNLIINGRNLDTNKPIENQQINQSSIFAYLGIRGLGTSSVGETVQRTYNAVPYLAYWDIYKNYYANKQEEIGAVIHATSSNPWNWSNLYIKRNGLVFFQATPTTGMPWGVTVLNGDEVVILADVGSQDEGKNITFAIDGGYHTPFEMFSEIISPANSPYVTYRSLTPDFDSLDLNGFDFVNPYKDEEKVSIQNFSLENIDKMRTNLLAQAITSPYQVQSTAISPYGLPMKKSLSNDQPVSQYSQEGLGLKTYQSDIFNNWLSTEWIDGDNGISSITAISTTDDYFTLDTLNLSQKVYNMLNRIAVSGGTYNDWMEAVYGTKPYNMSETPIYMGGLSKEVVFNEVVSTSTTEEFPLGTLGGKGGMAKKHKGGRVSIKCNEPCYIIGIVSLTPRVDYSQGNAWDVHLKTMDDLHKPALDEIGFQDLLTEQMAFWESIDDQKFSAGKQPAWLNYMTNFNKCYGNFADPNKEMFMTLNRRYEWETNEDGNPRIKDLTTYIDPSKYNYMFAQTSLDSQNFWVQIATDITARRKMSSKLMPNL